MTMELWTAASPNGWKVSIMLEELKEAGIELPEVEVKKLSLMDGDQFSDEFTAVSPNQKIPGLVDGNVRMMESCAILQYLGEKFPSPLLPDGDMRWQVISWLTWQAACHGPTLGNKLSYTRYMEDVPAEQKSHPLTRFNNEAQRLYRVLDKQLEGQDFICGDQFTIADIAIYPWVRAWKWQKVDITGHDNVVAWLERVSARPGVERGVKYCVPPEEAHQWSEERKRETARAGANIASNANIESAGK